MTITLGTIGERMDLLIRQGATFGPFKFVMKAPSQGAVPQADGSYVETDLIPVDLTGCALRGQIRKTPSDATVVAELNVSITDPTGGTYQFDLSDTVTAAIVAGVDLSKRESSYVWDFELTDSSNRVIPLYYGEVRVFREVTRV